MMRRFTSAPKPCVARAARTSRVERPVRVGARESRSARRRSARGSSSPRRSRRGSRPGSRTSRAAARRRRASRRAPRSASSAASNARDTSASTPSSSSARGTPIRRPRDVAGQRGRVVRHRLRRARRVRGSAPAITPSTSAASCAVRVERADLIERRGERDQAVARHAAVGRLQPDDAAQRRRLADRSAGVGAERQRRHARRRPRPPSRRSIRRECDRAPTDCAPGRTPSSRSTSPSRTRRSWSCRRSTAPAASSARHDGRVVGRHVVFEDPRRGGGADARACRCCP